MTYQRPTQSSSISAVLADGLGLYRAGIRSLYVPAFCLLLVIGLIQWGQIPYPHIEENAIPDAGHWLRFFATFVVSMFMFGVVIAIVHYIASGAPSGVRSPIAIATRRFPVVLAVSVPYALAISIGPLVLVLLVGLSALLDLPAILATLAFFFMMLVTLVPMMYLAIALFASFIVAIAEGRGPFESLRESFGLVRGHWWRTFALLAIITAAATLISLGTNEVILFLADRFDGKPVANTVSALAYAAIYGIFWPLSACLMYGVYQDLRLRRNDVAPTT
ncbi:MAG: hypothetical protein OXT64_07985 [Gammaproteobacteria bacterium]|nr:hypothetical protein [Gammaproteobacteria bacterium]